LARDRRRAGPPEEAARLELAVEDLDQAGRGVGRVDGKVVFATGALPGERVRARRTRRARRFDEARVEAVLTPSADRATPFCPVFDSCGGCTLQHLDPPAQRAWHEWRVAQGLARAAGHPADSWLAALSGPDRGYRVRARLAVRVRGGRSVHIGFRERGGDCVADTSTCDVLAPVLSGLIAPLHEALGGLRRPERVGGIDLVASEGDVAVVFHCRQEPSDEDLAALAGFARDHGVVAERCVAGSAPGPVDPRRPADLHYRPGPPGIVLRHASLDFVQANPVVNRQLVDEVRRLAEIGPGGRVADLYCGVGNFSLPLAADGAQVLGLDGDPGLVERARSNARDNGVDARARFERVDLADPVAGPWPRGWEPDAVVLDPPRGGAEAVAAALARLRPPRVVYVSCDPPALARDVGVLVRDGGYRLAAAGIADMFPHTGHVEALACLDAPGPGAAPRTP
jgi:23S rRNA (uracil1939-C5)-methyltransferase